MNIVNGATEPASPTAGTASPEKLVIRDRTDAKIFFEKLLKAVQIAIKALFFIGCGAIAMAMERLRHRNKTASGTGSTHDSSASETPQGIKVPVLPIDNYSRLNPDRIVENLTGLSREQLTLVRDFEAAHKHRNRILEAVDQRLAMNC
jgi:hypothetical protein